MGIELLIAWLWGIQAIATVVLAVRSALIGRWFAAAGAVLGAGLGVSPFLLMQGQGPAVWGPVIFIALASAVALPVIYAVARRWRALGAMLLLITIPLAYRVLAYASIPPSTHAILGPLAFLGEMAFLLGPILCSLVFREAFGWLDHIFFRRRSALT
jgi:hypothetical protein